MGHRNPPCAGNFHMALQPVLSLFLLREVRKLAVSLIAYADMAVRGRGGVCGATLSSATTNGKKKLIWFFQESQRVCANVMVTDSSQKDLFPYTSGKQGEGGRGKEEEEEEDTTTSLGFDRRQWFFACDWLTVSHNWLFIQQGKWSISKENKKLKLLFSFYNGTLQLGQQMYEKDQRWAVFNYSAQPPG